MSDLTNKQALLELFRRNSAPLSMSEIRCEINLPRTTLRNWLNKFSEQGHIVKVGRGKGMRYVATSSSSHIYREFTFSKQSEIEINYIRQPIQNRNLLSYNLDFLESYQPNDSTYLSPVLRQQLHVLGKRAKDHDPAGTYARKIYNRLLIDLSYNSSRLEGNTYSVLDTEKLLLEGTDASGKLDEEKTMLLNHKEAIRYLIDHAEEESIDINKIYTLHFLLSDGLVVSEYSGAIRDDGVKISGSTYIPIENKEVLESIMSQICEKANQIIDSFEQSIFLLIHIAYLQAFIDVNKRTARLSANIALIKNNLVPLSFNDIEKDDYIDAMLAIYERNSIIPLIELYCYSYQKICQLYDVTVEMLGFDVVRVRYRAQRRELLHRIIINKLYGSEIDNLIDEYSQSISEIDRQQFVTTVKDDIKNISVPRIAGSGITQQQLREWLKNH